MANKKRNTVDSRKKQRRGKPFTMYFSSDLANELNSVARERHVAKAALVRYAVDQLLKQFRSGQLELPLGV